MRHTVRVVSACCVLLVSLLTCALAQDNTAARPRYQKAPDTIRQILDSPPSPMLSLSPTRERALLVDSMRQPPVADLAQPMLRLAGMRINPATNGLHHPPRRVGLTLLAVADGKQQKLAVPAGALLGALAWSPDGRQFAFTNTTANTIELWVGDAVTGRLHKIAGVQVNGLSPLQGGGRGERGGPIEWMPDNRTLLVHTVARRGAPPVAPAVPDGPVIQESAGKAAPVRTYEDLLQTPYDEDLFDYYATAQLLLVDVATGKGTPVGKPALFNSVQISPDGKHLLVARVHRPYSYLLPHENFPKLVEVWDRTGKLEHKVADLPLEEHVPMEGVPTGPRSYHWRPSTSATLVWTEALDEGNPKKKVAHRDHVLMLSAPFTAQPVELIRTEHRYAGAYWGENGLVFASEFDRNRRWTRTFMLNADDPAQAPKLVWDRSSQDRYNDPGAPAMRSLPNGQRIIAQSGDSIFLAGAGASDKGDRPFLDRFNLKTLKSERIFQCGEGSFEEVTALLAPDASKFLTRYESPTAVPNYFVRVAGKDEKTALTKFPDPAPQLRGITKQLVRYKRADGVQLSFTLYLPPDCSVAPKGMGCRHGNEALPTIVWAYPLEYSDAGTAGQVSGSQYRFFVPSGISELFLVTQGYAILDNATMPVIGDPQTMNDTYLEQVVSSAKAAIDKAAEMGVTDPNRVGVGGHSYGAFMTANLLAHSDLFKAGVARSGAYNRTLTPFGFQSERRTFWEAPEMYSKVSPFNFAHQLKTPILLIHGMADDNSGTFPIQSERMYAAIKGNGGIVRYVQLPYEAHGYQGRESVEHVQWEMVNWFDKYVKNAAPKSAASAAK